MLAKGQATPSKVRPVRRLQGLTQYDVIEGTSGIVVQIGIGVPLNHGQPLAHAFIDAGHVFSYTTFSPVGFKTDAPYEGVLGIIAELTRGR